MSRIVSAANRPTRRRSQRLLERDKNSVERHNNNNNNNNNKEKGTVGGNVLCVGTTLARSARKWRMKRQKPRQQLRPEHWNAERPAGVDGGVDGAGVVSKKGKTAVGTCSLKIEAALLGKMVGKNREIIFSSISKITRPNRDWVRISSSSSISFDWSTLTCQIQFLKRMTYLPVLVTSSVFRL